MRIFSLLSLFRAPICYEYVLFAVLWHCIRKYFWVGLIRSSHVEWCDFFSSGSQFFMRSISTNQIKMISVCFFSSYGELFCFSITEREWNIIQINNRAIRCYLLNGPARNIPVLHPYLACIGLLPFKCSMSKYWRISLFVFVLRFTFANSPNAFCLCFFSQSPIQSVPMRWHT